jgi:hypothetical protein
MKVVESKAALEAFIASRGIDPGTSPVGDVCRACVDFYAQVRAEGIVPLEEDGDMFLFQWGRSEYSKRPADFHIDLVRQFGIATADDDPRYRDEPEEVEYFQLHCTIWLPAMPFSSLPNGHQWLDRPAQAADFRSAVTSHPVLLQARNQRQTAHEIMLEKV